MPERFKNLLPDTMMSPTPEERTYAMLAHVLQLFGGFIGPLVIFILRRNSRFVAFHALQALLWQVAYLTATVIGVGVWFVLLIGGIAISINAGPSKASPLAIFLFFPLIWLFLVGGWIVTLILSTVYGVKANRGQWASYPIIGRWAQRLAGG